MDGRAKRRVSVMVPGPLMAALERRAQREGIAVTELAEHLLEQHARQHRDAA